MSYNVTCNQYHYDMSRDGSVTKMSYIVTECQTMSKPCFTMSNLVMKWYAVHVTEVNFTLLHKV